MSTELQNQLRAANIASMVLEDAIGVSNCIDGYKKNPTDETAKTINSYFQEVSFSINLHLSQTKNDNLDTFWKKQSKRLEKHILPVIHKLAEAQDQSPCAQISYLAKKQGFIAFYDDKTDPLTSVFGNFHPCKIEYSGLQYECGEAVLQGQKFTDQPEIQQQFLQADGDTAVKKGQTQMTPSRLANWNNPAIPHENKWDVMLYVSKAKYGQNEHLKEMLLATGSAYLVEHLPDQYKRDKCWSDGYYSYGGNLKDTNNLGKTLMKLREQLGGTGIVEAPDTYRHLLKMHILNPTNSHTMVAQNNPYHGYRLPLDFNYYQPCSEQDFKNFYAQNKCTKCDQWKYVDQTGTISDYCSNKCRNSFQGQRFGQ